MAKKYKNLPPDKISSWLERNFECKPRKHGEEIIICNPFDGDAGYHFNINVVKGMCHDWRGNDEWAGPITKTGHRNCSFINFVRLYLKTTYKGAVESVLGAEGNPSDYLTPQKRPTTKKAKDEPSVALPAGARKLTQCDPLTTMLIKWLHSRGVDMEEIQHKDIHHLGSEVIWPYYEFEELVYWQSRSRLNKRFSFPDLSVGVGKGDYLYGFDYVDLASYLIITEAIFGVHTLREQAIASGGAGLSPNQIKKIRLLGPRDGVILAPDNDQAGIKSLLKDSSAIAENGYKVYYSLPPKIEYIEDGVTKYTKDWNELYTGPKLSLKEIRQIFENDIKPLTSQEKVKLRLS